MPETIEAPSATEAGKTNLGDVFGDTEGKFLPNILEPLESEGELLKEPEKAPAKATEAPTKPAEAVESKKSVPTPDDLFDAAIKPQKTEEVAKTEEPKKLSPEELVAFYEKLGIKGEKARENFEKLASETHAKEQKIAEYEKEIAKERNLREAGDPNAQAKIKELEDQVKVLSPLAERGKLESHPAFIQRFTQPKEAALTAAKAIASDHQVDPVQLEKALVLTGRAKADALDSIYEQVQSPSQRNKLERIVDQIEFIDSEAEKALSHAKETNQKFAEDARVQQYQSLEQHTETTLKHLSAAKTFLREEGKLEVLQDSSDENWNKQREVIDAQAKRLMTETTDPTELAAAAYLAASCGAYRNLAISKMSEVKDLKEQLKEYRDSEPGIGEGKPKPSSGEDDTDPEDFIQNAVKSLRSEGVIQSSR